MADTPFLNSFGYTVQRGERLALLIHGAGMDSTVWTLQARYLASHDIPVLAPDLPGHGRSKGKPLPSIEAMAEWLAALLEEFGAHRVVLAGHSMGALVALATSRRMGDRCCGLALLGAASEMPVHPDLIRAAREDLPLAASLIGDWAFAAGIEAGRQSLPGASLGWQARRLLESSRPGVLAGDLEACAAFALEGSIACPGLVIAGARDRMTPRKKSRALAETLNAEYVELAHSGHMMLLEEPAAVRRLLASHLCDWLAHAG